MALPFSLPWLKRPARPAGGTPPPEDEDDGADPTLMTLSEHLAELRMRLLIAAAAVLACTLLSFFFYKQILLVLMRPALNTLPVAKQESLQAAFQAINYTEAILTTFKVTLLAGIILASPIVVYEIWAFVAPGLTRKERRLVYRFVPGATLSFLVGVAFGYFVLLPTALRFLGGWLSNLDPNVKVTILPTLESYVALATKLLLWIGLIFELPLALYFLARLGIVNPRMLGGLRRYVIVGAFILGAIATPTPDPVNQALVAVPILVLWEIGVLLARLAT